MQLDDAPEVDGADLAVVEGELKQVAVAHNDAGHTALWSGSGALPCRSPPVQLALLEASQPQYPLDEVGLRFAIFAILSVSAR